MLIDHYIGFLLVLTAETKEDFFRGYRLAKAGRKPEKIWKQVSKPMKFERGIK